MRPYRILLALDKFKGTLSSREAALVLEQGLREGLGARLHEHNCETQNTDLHKFDIKIWPVSDGGQGLLEALQHPLQLVFKPVWVPTPHGTWTQAQLGWQPTQQRVVIESSQTTGLHLIPPELRHPLQLNSAGLGSFLQAAAALDPQEILIGLGSSGTVDGGMGLAQALGYGLWDAANQALPALPSHARQLARISLPETPVFHPDHPPRIIGLCDVNNPVLGAEGGVRVYGPQKGATAAELDELEVALAHWAERLVLDLGLPTSAEALLTCPGAGAAGGLGMGLKALLGAELQSGAQWFFSVSGLEQALEAADLLITGEGQFDQQSGFGKWPAHVIEAAQKKNLPVVLVTGQRIQGPVPKGLLQSYALVDFAALAAESPSLSQVAMTQVGRMIAEKIDTGNQQSWF